MRSYSRTASEGGSSKNKGETGDGSSVLRELLADGVKSVESRDWGLFAAAAMEIVHRDIDINFAARCLDAQDHGFGVGIAGKSFFAHVNFRRKYLEPESLIVQKGNRIADDHVGQFADRLADNLLALWNRRAREMPGNADGHFRSEIKNDAALDVALNQQ